MRIKCGGLAKPRSYLLQERVLSLRNKVQKGSERGGFSSAGSCPVRSYVGTMHLLPCSCSELHCILI